MSSRRWQHSVTTLGRLPTYNLRSTRLSTYTLEARLFGGITRRWIHCRMPSDSGLRVRNKPTSYAMKATSALLVHFSGGNQRTGVAEIVFMTHLPQFRRQRKPSPRKMKGWAQRSSRDPPQHTHPVTNICLSHFFDTRPLSVFLPKLFIHCKPYRSTMLVQTVLLPETPSPTLWNTH